MNLKALTSKELESIAEAIEAIHCAYDKLKTAGALSDADDISTIDLYDAIVQEATDRAMEDAGYKVNQMVARGELDRYMRPDGLIGYAPPWRGVSARRGLT